MTTLRVGDVIRTTGRSAVVWVSMEWGDWRKLPLTPQVDFYLVLSIKHASNGEGVEVFTRLGVGYLNSAEKVEVLDPCRPISRDDRRESK